MPKLLKIHFVGIGGIGISGLARFVQAQGIEITGSDIAIGSEVQKLQAKGVKIAIPHSADIISDQDLVIHSTIIKEDNVELVRARELGVKILSRKDALPLLLENRLVFSVCGAHGKSTTSAMLSSIFPEFGAIIGAHSKEFDSNVRAKKSQYIVFEADESDRSFLQSNPFYAIVPNAEPEHMETYNYDLGEFYAAYDEFLDIAKRRVVNNQDSFLEQNKHVCVRLNPENDIKNIRYILKDDEPHTQFELSNFGEFEVYGFGAHIASNAALAIMCAIDFGKSIGDIRENLLNFKGIRKRFDILQKGKCVIIDDYAHHPTEILATLRSVQIYANLKDSPKIIAIFQPHKFSRLLHNLESFRVCFRGLCDELIILPVWRAGEEEVQVDLAKEFSEYKPLLATHIVRDNEKILVYSDERLLKVLDEGIIVGMGAGDITYQLRGEKH